MSIQTNNTTTRERILGRIQAALRDVPADEKQEIYAVSRTYLHHDGETQEEHIERFVERVRDYKAVVRRIQESELPTAIADAFAARSLHRLIVPSNIPASWLPDGVEVLCDTTEKPLTYEQLDTSDGVLTGCALGIAQTGTIVLDGGQLQGRRVLTLLPDYALCVIREEQIVGLVPEAISQLAEVASVRRQPITFVSGPSATSDIELSRVEGVHGPRTLEVLVVH